MRLADLLYKLPENAYIWVYILDRDCEKDDQYRVFWEGFVKEFPYFVEQQTHRNLVQRIKVADTGAFFLIYLV